MKVVLKDKRQMLNLLAVMAGSVLSNLVAELAADDIRLAIKAAATTISSMLP